MIEFETKLMPDGRTSVLASMEYKGAIYEWGHYYDKWDERSKTYALATAAKAFERSRKYADEAENGV